jgi:hypothetical protein
MEVVSVSVNAGYVRVAPVQGNLPVIESRGGAR